MQKRPIRARRYRGYPPNRVTPRRKSAPAWTEGGGGRGWGRRSCRSRQPARLAGAGLSLKSGYSRELQELLVSTATQESAE